MNKQRGFGLIMTILFLAVVAVIGWYVFGKMTNMRDGETPQEAIDRAKTNVDKVNEASSKVKDTVNQIDSN